MKADTNRNGVADGNEDPDGDGWDADPSDPGDWVSSADYNGWNALWTKTNPGQANPGNPFSSCAPGVTMRRPF